MKYVAEHVALVKEQLEFHERSAERFASEPARAGRHTRTAERLKVLLAELIALGEWQAANPDWRSKSDNQAAKRLSLTWEEVEGLPPELLAELSISDSDRTEFAIISAIRLLGGVASLDRIIIRLYKETGEIHKRLPLNQRLYRMVQKNLIFSVLGKKGVYSLEPLSEEEAATII